MIRARILSLLACVLLAVTSIGFGVARGQADVAGQVVLCSGHGFAMVQVDANGEAIGHPQLCPDCAAVFFADTSDAFAPFAAPLRHAVPGDVAAEGARPRGAGRFLRPLGRAPPVLI
ncbi:hypothetical protein IV417_15275 [Alphaproteobacteria bacterium KMM 3653]|uniref:DUF2946 domain-containing protein n=1 Tax=Harenicola maris TaxID=2841044 RepID=A0AAP2G4W7_9RHOB|nr:hypothetical protein [Harenicola maris]